MVEDFERRPKPVVLVKKLSVEQIQRIIRHSKSGKNRISSGKSGKSKKWTADFSCISLAEVFTSVSNLTTCCLVSFVLKVVWTQQF